MFVTAPVLEAPPAVVEYGEPTPRCGVRGARTRGHVRTCCSRCHGFSDHNDSGANSFPYCGSADRHRHVIADDVRGASHHVRGGSLCEISELSRFECAFFFFFLRRRCQLCRRRLRSPLLVVAIKSAIGWNGPSTDGPWSSTDGRVVPPFKFIPMTGNSPPYTPNGSSADGRGGRPRADGRGGRPRADGRGGRPRADGRKSRPHADDLQPSARGVLLMKLLLEPITKRREDLGKHSVYAHFPKDRNCEICKRTKITRAPCRRRNGEAVPRADNFGDLITADHKVLSDNCESRNNHRYAVVVQDLATQWIQAYPCKNKTSQETQRSLQKFLEPERKPKVIYTDNSLEFGKACEDLSWNHCTSTPHRSETNGIAERAVRRVKEGTSAVLLQSGLNESWWADSMECYTYLRNVRDLLSDGKTPYERRFGQPFKGPIIPFGSLVEYHPIIAKDQSRIHQFGKKVLPGLFLGYALYAGGLWKGDVLIADLEELETMDASEINSKRLNAKVLIYPKEQGEFFFQSHMDESKPLEEIRT